jgi:hypothetical protein
MKISHHTLPFLFFISLFLFSDTLSAQTWKLAKNKDGIKIETRFIDGWSIKQYRATIIIKTTLAKAVDAYRNPVKRKSFMKRSLDVYNIKEVSSSEIITYNLGNAPWPVADRDNITRSIFTTPTSNEVKVTMTSLPNYIPEKSGIVRVPRTMGYWRFIDQGDGTVKVIQQSVADLGGSVPDWIVNSFIVEGPFDTLSALKGILE